MASQNHKAVGKVFNHDYLGKVIALKAVPNSRVKVEVECIERGVGWDDIQQRYKGVRTENGWMRGENHQFGFKDEVNINELSKID